MAATDQDLFLQIKLESDWEPQFKVNTGQRRVSGLVMPWGVVAMDSRGIARWRFERGSIAWSDIGRVKLLRDHDIHKPVGVATELEDRSAGLWGSYRVARTPAGDEVLTLAEDGILDGFSAGPVIEADGWEMDPHERGVRRVGRSLLKETTITAMPAYDDARVMHVAAMLWTPDGDLNGQGQDPRAWRGWGG